MELAETDAVVGMQDMGAAGITCSSCEMSAAGEYGMDIWLDRVPLRQKMEAWEILLSESQERMLVVVEKGKEQKVLDIFDKWDLECEEIGCYRRRHSKLLLGQRALEAFPQIAQF